MKENTHHIKKEVFEVSTSLENKAVDIQEEILVLAREELRDIANEVLDEFNPDLGYVSVDVLTIDLGKISHKDLAVEMPKRFREAFRKALRNLLIRKPLPPGEGDEDNIKESETALQETSLGADMLYYFLSKGYFPTWPKESYSLRLNSLIETLLEQNPEELRFLLERLEVTSTRKNLEKYAQATVRTQLMERFPDIDLVKGWERSKTHETATKEKSSGGDGSV
jgi:hypothetical protein